MRGVVDLKVRVVVNLVRGAVDLVRRAVDSKVRDLLGWVVGLVAHRTYS